MTVHLPIELERFVAEAVRSGRYTHEDDVIRDALIRLKQSTSTETQSPGKRGMPRKPSKPRLKLTEAEVLQHMLDVGLISQLPERSADFDDPDDQPITIIGEPLSETVIRERR